MTMTTNNTTNNLHCIGFIIPNGLTKAKDYYFRSEIEEAFGALDDNDLLVQMWYASEDPYKKGTYEVKDGLSDNWTDHGVGSEAQKIIDASEVNWPRHPDYGCLTPYLTPVKFLAGKKDGDTVKLNMYGLQVNVKIDQANHRYCTVDFAKYIGA